MGLSESSIALDALLSEGGPAAEAIKAEVHRTVLWRYRTGRSKPDAATLSKIERLSGGRVRAGGWGDLPEQSATGTDNG